LDCKTVFIDSTHVKVHRCGLNPVGGREAQAIGKTKGGWNTKVHAAVNQRGRPVSLLLSAGNDADISHAADLTDNLGAGTVVADKGYDSDEFRIWLFENDANPCIPAKSNRIDPLPYSKRTYRKRHLVENCFESIKTFRRVATRYDKLAETFFGWVMIAVAIKFGF
jgi:transposase